MSIQKWMKYEFEHIWFGLETNGEKKSQNNHGVFIPKNKNDHKMSNKKFCVGKRVLE